jgi:hypothetical protein
MAMLPQTLEITRLLSTSHFPPARALRRVFLSHNSTLFLKRKHCLRTIFLLSVSIGLDKLLSPPAIPMHMITMFLASCMCDLIHKPTFFEPEDGSTIFLRSFGIKLRSCEKEDQI